MNTQQILGLDERDIVFGQLNVPVHKELVAPFLFLQQRAAEAGFALTIASGYRSFERQLAIWNAKLSGQRPVCGNDGGVIDIVSLTPWQQLQAVMRWSAVPGASRHHWGCDIDIYDQAAVDKAYQLQLTPAECYADGPFRPMHDWLDDLLRQEPELGFFRPYEQDLGGIAAERWHLSYAPVAWRYQQQLSEQLLSAHLRSSEVILADVAIEHLPEIMLRYVAVPVEFYPEPYRSLLSEAGDTRDA